MASLQVGTKCCRKGLLRALDYVFRCANTEHNNNPKMVIFETIEDPELEKHDVSTFFMCEHNKNQSIGNSKSFFSPFCLFQHKGGCFLSCVQCCKLMWQRGMAPDHECGDGGGGEFFRARPNEEKYLCAGCGKMFFFEKEPEDLLPPPSKKAKKNWVWGELRKKVPDNIMSKIFVNTLDFENWNPLIWLFWNPLIWLFCFVFQVKCHFKNFLFSHHVE